MNLKHCASSKTSVKSSRKCFVYLNWIRLATNLSWLDSSIGRVAVWEPEDASSNPARDNEFFVVLCSVRLIWNLVFRFASCSALFQLSQRNEREYSKQTWKLHPENLPEIYCKWRFQIPQTVRFFYIFSMLVPWMGLTKFSCMTTLLCE